MKNSNYSSSVHCLPYLHTSQQQLGVSLWMASGRGDVGRVTELLKKGANVNWRYIDLGAHRIGLAVLHEACLYNRAEVVKELLKHSPSINQQTKNGDTPLHLACREGHIECAKLLLATEQCDLG